MNKFNKLCYIVGTLSLLLVGWLLGLFTTKPANNATALKDRLPE